MANAHLGLASTGEDMSIQFVGEVGMNLFKQKYPTNIAEGSENNFYLKGDVWKPINDQRFGLAWDFNTYSYSMDDMKGTTSLELNPYYGFENDDWRIRLGAHVDWWSGIDDEVNFSPDVNVEYIFSDSYVLYAKAGGGRENKSLMELTEFTPYWTLSHPYILPTYMSLDAAIGLKASPMNGLWLNLTGGYQIREDDLFWKLVDGSASYLGFEQGKSKVAYGSAELKYDYKDLFDLGLKATYYHWKGDKMEGLDQYAEERLLALKSEMELNAEVGFKPVQGLRINAGYEYVKRAEEIYDPISNLYVGADYALMKNLSIFAKANNLLNKEYVRADAYPAQKLNFLAGLSLQF
jgi:outer membrane receptor protein involved in Fe transport